MAIENQQLSADSLNSERLYLTANSRIAEYLERGHALSAQDNIFRPANIFTLDNYCKQLQSAYFPDQMLLTSNEYILIWQLTMPRELECISESATLAHKAWEICTAWEIPDHELENSHYYEVEIFIKWKKQFIQFCHNNKLICRHEVYSRIINNPDKFAEKFTAIHWVGFQELTPQLKSLQASLGQDQEINFLQQPASCNDSAVYAADDNTQLWQAMSAWLKQTQTAEPFTTVCAIPNLNAVAEELSIILHANFPEHCDEKPIFNISMQRNLADFPFFNSIIAMLHSQHSDFNLNYFCDMLKSGFFCNNLKNRIQNVDLEKLMRSNLDLSCDLKNLKKFLNLSQAQNKAADLWYKFFTMQPDKSKKSPSAWLALLRQWQDITLWPGQLYNNNNGTQLWEQWQKIQDQLNRLDYIVAQVSYQEFCSIASSLIKNSKFQFYNKNTAPIQILGVVEAAGIPCRNLCFANCDANNWPLSATPNPFIPYTLQRKLGLPHSSCEREFDFAEQITGSLLQQAANTMLLYSKNLDSTAQQISPLLTNTKQTKLELMPLQQTAWHSAPAEFITDSAAPTITEPTSHAGGSSLLQSMATCPLQAQLRWRLAIKNMHDWRLGPDSRSRGQLIHSCMEYIWLQLKDQTQLQLLNDAEQSKLIKDAIDTAFSEASKLTPINSVWKNNEYTLVENILHHWLAAELKRPAFSVHSCEQTTTLTVANLRLKLRVDRIDKIDQNKLLIIDYKTGKCSNKQLLEENTTATQLPLYLYKHKHDVAALAFAQISTEATKLSGISDNDLDIPGITACADLKTNWPDLTNNWDKHLTDLAKRFADSDARIMPHTNNACKQCEFLTICEAQTNV